MPSADHLKRTPRYSILFRASSLNTFEPLLREYAWPYKLRGEAMPPRVEHNSDVRLSGFDIHDRRKMDSAVGVPGSVLDEGRERYLGVGQILDREAAVFVGNDQLSLWQ